MKKELSKKVVIGWFEIRVRDLLAEFSFEVDQETAMSIFKKVHSRYYKLDKD